MENIELNQLSGFNPMKDFTSIYQNETKKLLNGGDLGSYNILEGKIQIQLPKDIESFSDPELVQDLKTLTSNNSQSYESSSVKNLSSVEAVSRAFSNALGDGINKVNNAQHAAENAIETFATGGNIDVHSVMIAEQKANLSLQMAMQMRNKLVQAYQEISRLQV